MFESRVNSDSLDKLLMLVEHFEMISFFDAPYINSFVHAGRDDETGIFGPLQVEDVFSMAH